MVSGSSQISFTGLTNVPSGLVSGSSQVLNGTTIHSGSFFNGISVVSGSGQISFSGITGVPSGIVSSSIQIKNYGDFATTGSNTFKGNQIITGSVYVSGSSHVITGSLTVSGSVSATSFFELSDIRYKDIISVNPNVDLSTLDVIQFTLKGDNQVRYGYSAQSVKEACSDLVVGDLPMSVNYNDVHTLKIHQLENKIKQLENKIESLYVIIMDRDNQK